MAASSVSSPVEVLSSDNRMELNQGINMRKRHCEVTKCNIKRLLVGECNSCEGSGVQDDLGRLERYLSRDMLSDSTELPSRIRRRTQTYQLHIGEAQNNAYYVNATLSFLGPGFCLS